MIREKTKKLVEDACKKVFKDRKSIVTIGKPPKEEFGDYTAKVYFLSLKKRYSSSMSEMMVLPSLKESARLIDEIRKSPIFSDFFSDVEFQDPFFINFFVSKEYLQKQVKDILKKEDKFGNLKIGKNQKVNVEFISANPTGPLTLGNARGGFGGDVLSNILEKAGYNVTREFYINDRGKQIENLKRGLYKGETRTASQIQKENQKTIIKDMKIKFDIWFSERNLYKNKEIDKVLALLKRKKLTYKKEGALWFKSTEFGDDKDRVLIRENGKTTYFASEVAYLKNKFNRRFKKLIIFLGADHYGYVKRMKAAVMALGYEKNQLDFVIFQLVAIMWTGGTGEKELIKMSKREGTYRSISELVDEKEGVGLDVSRFFFLQRGTNSHLTFDLDLAKEKSSKNPVYYVQYAYARISSILRKAKTKPSKDFKLLKEDSELDLIKQLIRFPEIIEDTAKNYQVQRLPQYAIDLATVFHQFYRNCRVISDDKKLTKARLSLISATKIILKSTLDLMGISAPEEM